VLRWTADGYFEVLAAERGEVVSAEPFEALPFQVGVAVRTRPRSLAQRRLIW